jgi:hypothetical protein
MGRVGEQNEVSVSMLLLIYLKKKTIHDAVCNKICAPHVIYPDARAAGKRFYIEASVRDIERFLVCALNGSTFNAWRRTGSHANQARGTKKISYQTLSRRTW